LKTLGVEFSIASPRSGLVLERDYWKRPEQACKLVYMYIQLYIHIYIYMTQRIYIYPLVKQAALYMHLYRVVGRREPTGGGGARLKPSATGAVVVVVADDRDTLFAEAGAGAVPEGTGEARSRMMVASGVGVAPCSNLRTALEEVPGWTCGEACAQP
jgi:hypothetical protein